MLVVLLVSCIYGLSSACMHARYVSLLVCRPCPNMVVIYPAPPWVTCPAQCYDPVQHVIDRWMDHISREYSIVMIIFLNHLAYVPWFSDVVEVPLQLYIQLQVDTVDCGDCGFMSEFCRGICELAVTKTCIGMAGDAQQPYLHLTVFIIRPQSSSHLTCIAV